MSDTELLVGIDVGTTLCKAAVVRAGDGIEVAHGAVRTPWTDVPTGAEVAPAELLDAALAATAAALEQAPGGPVVGVGVTSMAETGVLLDRHGRAAAPAIAWHDARGQEEAARLAADLNAERFRPAPACRSARCSRSPSTRGCGPTIRGSPRRCAGSA